jgi:uncharacterized membrane protein
MTSVKYKRKREELSEETLYRNGESTLTQILRFLWRLLTAPIVWSWRQSMRLLAATWRMIRSALAWTLRSTWKIITWTFRSAWDATVWTVKAPFRAVGWVWQLIFGPPVRYSNPRYAEIHALIARRYRRRSRFITHLFAFILTNALFWIDLFYKENYYSSDYPFSFRNNLLIFTALWVVVLLFHFIRMRHGVEEDHTIEQAIERERQWEAAQRNSYDDPYVGQDRYARLSADSELLEQHKFMDWEKRKNRN